MKAYLLAAGYATRLHPLTLDRAKPLLDVAGRPILSHILDSVLALDGVSEVVVVANDRFFAQFAEWASTLDAPVPVRLLDDGTRDDRDKRGAIGDLAFALAEAPPGDDEWLVAAGDNLFAFDLRPLQQEFRSRRTPLLVLREVTHGRGPTRYNEVTVDRDGRAVRFREKPRDPCTGLAAIALYFFTPEVTALLDEYLAGGGNRDAPGHFISWLVERIPVGTARCGGPWFDIGSFETLEQARRRYADAVTRGSRPPRRP